MSTSPRPFDVSALHVAESKLAAANTRVAELEAVLAQTVRASSAGSTPMEAANRMVKELHAWDGFNRVNQEAFAGLTVGDFVLVGAAR